MRVVALGRHRTATGRRGTGHEQGHTCKRPPTACHLASSPSGQDGGTLMQNSVSKAINPAEYDWQTARGSLPK